MNPLLSSLRTGLVAICFATASSLALADMDADDFVNDASAMGLAEVHNATLALTKASSQDVKNFAQRMLDDHSAANQQLAQIASGKEDLELADDATLLAKAKALILQLRSGESFDQAYANNQVVAHEKSVELYENAAKELNDADLKAYAAEKLPELREHLTMARDLAAKHGGDAAKED